ncbi:MAG: exopolyphosphatase, partial [Cyclobacteriaceae bacterium]|nr:exopolyphosphatase [Cyclobacteriaceae bacterium]
MNEHRFAIIDLGTNTFHLLIVDYPSGTLLHEEKRAVRAGKGGISQDTISQEATLRIVDALKYFVETGKKF